MGRRLTSLRVAASKIDRIGTGGDQGELAVGREFETVCARHVCRKGRRDTSWLRTSMMEMVPSPALAIQASLPSGETSKPSSFVPTGTTVSSQSPPGGRIERLAAYRALCLRASGRTFRGL